MYFESLSALFSMAGHGTYVWSAYGISAFTLALLIVVPVKQYHRFIQQIQNRVETESQD